MTKLTGQVALVAGATRGAGRGIARMLGEAGATVYCTGRGSRAAPSAAGAHAGRPETIEETAEMVTAAGGVGIPVRVDHEVEEEVVALMARVRREQRRLDVLVNVLGGLPADHRAFAKRDVSEGRALTESWVWPHVTTARHALPLMITRKSGLVVEVLETPTLDYLGDFYFDLAVVALKRLVYALAEELAPHRVTAVAIAPGFMRTEQVLDELGATPESWQTVATESAAARGFGFAGSETPCFVGRAIAALAADPDLRRWSGRAVSSWGLSEEYGFADVDDGRPHWGRYIAEHFPKLAKARPRSGVRWAVTADAG